MRSPNRYRRADIRASARSHARGQSMGSAGMPQACGRRGCAEAPVVRAANLHQSAKARALQTIAANARCGTATAAQRRPAAQAKARVEAKRFPPSMARVEYARLRELIHARRSLAPQASAA